MSQLRISREPYDSTKDCLFCGNKVETSKVSFDYDHYSCVRTFTFVDQILTRCKTRNYAWSSSVQGRIEYLAETCMRQTVCTIIHVTYIFARGAMFRCNTVQNLVIASELKLGGRSMCTDKKHFSGCTPTSRTTMRNNYP